MPMPKPRPSEDKPTFISRCMGDSVMNSDYPNQAQRYAVCNDIWRRRHQNVWDRISEDFDKLFSNHDEKK